MAARLQYGAKQEVRINKKFAGSTTDGVFSQANLAEILPTTATTGQEKFTIGAAADATDAATNYLEGSVAAFIVFDTYLSDAEVGQAEDCLGQKYHATLAPTASPTSDAPTASPSARTRGRRSPGIAHSTWAGLCVLAGRSQGRRRIPPSSGRQGCGRRVGSRWALLCATRWAVSIAL